MDRRVTPPKRVTSPTCGPPPPCNQALKTFLDGVQYNAGASHWENKTMSYLNRE